ncbi:MAG: hypothetical protein OXE92_11355 [Bacteroidetes bacterium]|nr:hypothetical protein [Bacteroidota bacterium]
MVESIYGTSANEHLSSASPKRIRSFIDASQHLDCLTEKLERWMAWIGALLPLETEHRMIFKTCTGFGSTESFVDATSLTLSLGPPWMRGPVVPRSANESHWTILTP